MYEPIHNNRFRWLCKHIKILPDSLLTKIAFDFKRILNKCWGYDNKEKRRKVWSNLAKEPSVPRWTASLSANTCTACSMLISARNTSIFTTPTWQFANLNDCHHLPTIALPTRTCGQVSFGTTTLLIPLTFQMIFLRIENSSRRVLDAHALGLGNSKWLLSSPWLFSGTSPGLSTKTTPLKTTDTKAHLSTTVSSFL